MGWKKGMHHTEFTKQLLSEMHLGDKNPAKRPDVRKKLRASRLRYLARRLAAGETKLGCSPDPKKEALRRQRISATQTTPAFQRVKSARSTKMWKNRTKAQRRAVAKKISKGLLITLNLPATRKHRSECTTAIWKRRTPEEISKLVRRIVRTRADAVYVKGNLRIQMRSTWEVAFALWLDGNKIHWQYEQKTFLLNGVKGIRSYTPDFYLPKLRHYVEVRGRHEEKQVRKLEVFAKQYPDVAARWTLLRKLELLALGINVT